MCTRYESWSSLVEGGEGQYLPKCQTNLVIALYTLSQWTTASFDLTPEGSAQKVNNASTLQFITKYVFAFKTIQLISIAL